MEHNNTDQFFMDLLDNYNQAFYDKDINKLKEFYDSTNDSLIYFDNHKNNDTYSVEEHLRLISDFFKNGKATESGGVEPIIIENLHVFHKTDSACLCFITRYKSFPVPAVRATMYLERTDNQWKIIHVHCSFEPEK
jgi:ketosteroid isomerase-like protein